MSASPHPPRFKFKSFARYQDRYESVTAIYYPNGWKSSTYCRWWVKIMIKLSWGARSPSPDYDHGLRSQTQLEELFKAIDLDQIELLRDTVTKITFEPTAFTLDPIFIPIREGFNNHDNPYIASLPEMTYEIEEDERRIQHPAIDQVQISDIPLFENSRDLKCFGCIDESVFKVQIGEQDYIYKSIMGVHFEPEDTQNFLDEIAVLAKFRGYPNIAQIAGLVKSKDPYTTDRSAEIPSVLTGFLLEYSPGCTLQDLISDPEEWQPVDGLQVMKWAIQIGTALESMHKNGCTHIGLKPQNIMIDEDDNAGGFDFQWNWLGVTKPGSLDFDSEENALLVDVGGTGEFDRNWLPWEITSRFQVWDPENTLAKLPFERRVALDCWTYGKLLSVLVPEGAPADVLEMVASGLMTMDPGVQSSLSDSLAILKKNKHEMENWI
ncbi:uncharacterized protein N7483_008646 [Penicillium malachiteum]|uniref:uncharacterized protein n=1 Tax=Penicillium malachiteum TaxID=1324776 RepID=UPI002547C019|nr:uncharacterized protein N7483_008646 [Penicillium malachiteum]KAJ5720712.1 hypothetical protein N7483_008646 [Penicillium malachiteum]